MRTAHIGKYIRLINKQFCTFISGLLLSVFYLLFQRNSTDALRHKLYDSFYPLTLKEAEINEMAEPLSVHDWNDPK